MATQEFLKSNDLFSKMNDQNIQEILNTYNQIYYRYLLNFSSKPTFGIEIEFEGIIASQFYEIEEFIKKIPKWYLDIDYSLPSGGEVISPKLCNESQTWKTLRKICEYLKSQKVNTSQNAGAHIHVGADLLGSNYEAWRKFIKTYITYESTLLYFFYGEQKKARSLLQLYAEPIADIMYNRLDHFKNYTTVQELINFLPMDRRQSINFKNVNWNNLDFNLDRNTIEFRCPNGTIEETIWQNNINTVLHLMRLKEVDEEFLDYKLRKKTNGFLTEKNQKFRESLELVDILFSNNLDKINFLHQFSKDDCILNKSRCA